jgi:L-ascorbate metabolism protein UlaG (beta-lactamase superfamily)
MKDGELYLRPNVVIEPLVAQWYAWTHLISPATASRNITERHLKVMDSYIKSPNVHTAAVKNPLMLGGPFMNYDTERVEEIKALKETTLRTQANLIAFSKAIEELDALLRKEVDGSSLEPLYPKVPLLLQGYVELVYDLNHHSSFRLIEPLLYRSEYYDLSNQSIMLSLTHQDDRSFILSTPRLKDEASIHLPICFQHEGIDELSKMTQTPRTFSQIKDSLGFDDSMDDRFRLLLTAKAPSCYSSHINKGVRWRYFGHGCILLQTPTTSILFDPVLSYSYESTVSRYTYEDLPDLIDYVLITHNHQDHVMLETLLRLRYKTRHIVVPRNGYGALQDPSLRLLLENIGFKNVIELSEMDEFKIDNGLIMGLPFFGEHGDLNIQTKMAWRIVLDGHHLLFAADSCNISPALYRHVHKVIGDVDILFLGMECDGAPVSWIYGPLLTELLQRHQDRSRRLAGSNYEQGLDIVNTFKCKEVYVYAMGQEPWLNYIMSKKYTEDSNPILASNQLIKECRQNGIYAERLFGKKEVFL